MNSAKDSKINFDSLLQAASSPPAMTFLRLIHIFGQKFSCSILALSAIFTFNLSALFAEKSLANEQGLEADKCAGAFFVLTSISKREPKLGDYFQHQKELSLKVSIAKRTELYGRTLTRADINLAKDYGITFVDTLYKNSPHYMPQFVSDCLAWNTKIIEYLSGRDVRNVATETDFPKHGQLAKYPHSSLEDLAPFLYDAFEIWIQNGKPTPMKLKEAMEAPVSKTKEEFGPMVCYDFSADDDGRLPKKCETPLFQLAKMDCGNEHFRMPGQPYPETIKNVKDLIKYIKRNSLVNIGFQEQTEEYADCVLTLMDYYMPEKGVKIQPRYATPYIPNQKLMNAVVGCVEIGLTFNTPKYGRCVLKVIDNTSK